MVTPPPLPAHYRRDSFFHSAATISIFAPIFAVGFNMLSRAALGTTESGIPVLIVSAVSGLSLLTGIIAGIVALFGIPKYGRKGILVKALCGTLIPIILAGLAIPTILSARAKAQEIHKETNIQRELKKVADQLNQTTPQKSTRQPGWMERKPFQSVLCSTNTPSSPSPRKKLPWHSWRNMSARKS